MSDATGIEWADATWNPVVGCSIVSPGCMHYAVWTGKVALAPDHILTQPMKWKRPRRVFVNSMGDLFHESVPDAWIDRVFAAMALCPQHTFLVLTKRSARMRAYIDAAAHGERDQWPLANVWLGVSAEDQQRADERIPDLLATPAAKRFVSCEPLLGPISLRWLAAFPENAPTTAMKPGAAGTNELDGLRRLDWIIAGGESGPGARPLHPDWARGLRDQCVAARVPFFFKQWGEWLPVVIAPDESAAIYDDTVARGSIRRIDRHPDVTAKAGQAFARVGKSRAGRLLDGREWNEAPA
jgi:protein gp37